MAEAKNSGLMMIDGRYHSSYPYLHFSRRSGVPYGYVLSIVDDVENRAASGLLPRARTLEIAKQILGVPPGITEQAFEELLAIIITEHKRRAIVIIDTVLEPPGTARDAFSGPGR